MTAELYIGIMSGTSVDSVDAVIARFDEAKRSVVLVAKHAEQFPTTVHQQLQELIANPEGISLDHLGTLDRELGKLYAQAANNVMTKGNVKADDIAALGCHGQTVRHQPDKNPAFTIQLGDGATVAAETGVTTVNDFRSADIALGGQGAPLVCAFHAWAFAGAEVNAVVNIGGIANITVIAPGSAVSGYDTGPGNTLLDAWCMQHRGERFDNNGDWARSGTSNAALLDSCRSDSYFARPAPKSTGREHFHMNWLNAQLQGRQLATEDVQATLVELTAGSIADAATAAGAQRIWLCGGGAHNGLLAQRIAAAAEHIPVATTESLGVSPVWVEATAFAWLARARLTGVAAGTPSVTGARRAGHLGALHLPPGA